jgi:hypothetical protein
MVAPHCAIKITGEVTRSRDVKYVKHSNSGVHENRESISRTGLKSEHIRVRQKCFGHGRGIDLREADGLGVSTLPAAKVAALISS